MKRFFFSPPSGRGQGRGEASAKTKEKILLLARAACAREKTLIRWVELPTALPLPLPEGGGKDSHLFNLVELPAALPNPSQREGLRTGPTGKDRTYSRLGRG